MINVPRVNAPQIDPNMALKIQAPSINISPAINAFFNARNARNNEAQTALQNERQVEVDAQNKLINEQNLQKGQLNINDAIALAQDKEELREANSLINAGNRSINTLSTKGFEAAEQELISRKQTIDDQEGNSSDTLSAMGKLTEAKIANDPSIYTDFIKSNVDTIQQGINQLTGANSQSSSKVLSTDRAVLDGVTGRNITRQLPTGEVVSEFIPAQTGVELVSSTGETSTQRQEREVATAAEKKTETLKAEAENIADVEIAKGQGRDIAQTIGLDISEGFEASNSLSDIESTIELLNIVDTGGIDNALLYAKQKLGIESADEGDLNNRLKQSFIRQIKPIFGGAPSKDEVMLLQNIEADFGKSNATNKKLLERAKEAVLKKSVRGLRVAGKAGRFGRAEEIRLNLGISEEQVSELLKSPNKDIVKNYERILKSEKTSSQPEIKLESINSVDLTNLSTEELQKLLGQ